MMQTHHFASNCRPSDIAANPVPVAGDRRAPSLRPDAGAEAAARPLVSIIIPNYSGGATIERCLEAAFASRAADIEVIVVDDASEDDSLERIRRFPCRLVRMPGHGGAARARNAGARASRGEVLFFTDADCLLDPDAVAHAVETLGGGADVAVGGTYTLSACEPGFFDRFQSAFIHYFESRRAPEADYLATHALAIASATFRSHSGFAEQGMPILEDVEFSHRLRRSGCRLVMNPAVQARHIFGYSLAGSLRNAYRKTRYWTCYSLGNRDLLADSGTASRELKLDVVAWCLVAMLLVAGAAEGRWILAAAAVLAANATAARGLLGAFRRAHGPGFATAAGLYYFLLYPAAVGAGALAGLGLYLARQGGMREAA